jgi:xanthine/CO dehydrogenase XdhC/CoxF family maturation factor
MTSSTELADLLRVVLELWDRERPFVVATVLRADGATPVKAGAKAILVGKRVVAGTVGGGLVEAETQRHAAAARRSNQPMLFDFQLQGAGIGSASPVCGGTMRVLIDPTVSGGHQAFAQAAAALQRRERGIWLTTIEHRSRLEVSTRWLAEPTIAAHTGFPTADHLFDCLDYEAAQLFVQSATPDLARRGSTVRRGSPDPAESSDRQVSEIFVEPVIPKPVLLIVGAGLSSVRCGLRAMSAAIEAVLVAPGDQASVDARLVSDLLTAYHQADRRILVPIHAGRRGHPLVFSAAFGDEILTRFDDTGLRGLLLAHPDEVFEWSTQDPAVLEDLDTPEDYLRALDSKK